MNNNENSKSDENLANLLNISTNISKEDKIEKIESSEISIGKTADNEIDYNIVRKNLKKLILTSEIAIEGILNVANEGDSPRAYEVVSDLIKTSLDANNRLMDLHKTVKDLNKEETKTKGDTVTNNSIFVGNTTDLLKMLRQKKLNISATENNIIDEPKIKDKE